MTASPQLRASRVEFPDEDELEGEGSTLGGDASDEVLEPITHDDPVWTRHNKVECIRIPAAVEIPGHGERPDGP